MKTLIAMILFMGSHAFACEKVFEAFDARINREVKKMGGTSYFTGGYDTTSDRMETIFMFQVGDAIYLGTVQMNSKTCQLQGPGMMAVTEKAVH